MPKHRVTLSPADWPADLRAAFERGANRLSEHQRRRLMGAFGRWLKNAHTEGLPPDLVTMELWRTRTAALAPHRANAVRQAVAMVYPDKEAALYAPDAERKPVRSEREKLTALIERSLPLWPEAWRIAAAPLLRMDPDGVEDGILVQAWAASTIKRHVETASGHFAFCRANDLPEDINPSTVRANMRARQARCAAGDLRIGGTAIYLGSLRDFACAVRPDRSWGWLRKASERFGKIAAHHPSRNAGRVVEIIELRQAAIRLMSEARRMRSMARIQRQRVAAHTVARTALGMLLLSEAPVRVKSLAGIEIGLQISEDLRTMRLAPHETKEGEADQRRLSDLAVETIAEYLTVHRAVVAPAAERRLFVGMRGVPLSGEALSRNIGDFCEKKFGTRATAHPIRNAAADFIVSEAPEEAALASTILNHSSRRTTDAYVGTANQVIAGRALRQATAATAAAVGAVTSSPMSKKKPARPRSLRAELAEGMSRRMLKKARSGAAAVLVMRRRPRGQRRGCRPARDAFPVPPSGQAVADRP